MIQLKQTKELLIEVNLNFNYFKYITRLQGNIRSMSSINQIARVFEESFYLELSQKSELPLHQTIRDTSTRS